MRESIRMKKLLIDINLGNAAFEGADAGAEIASILRDLADKLESAPIPAASELLAALYDVNGNCVGFCFTACETKEVAR